MFKRVRVGKVYRYEPVGMDIYDPASRAKRGELVKVVNQYGCPPANTMGHCYIAVAGQFAGLVLTNSLQEVQR